jgi:hypothetical protein
VESADVDQESHAVVHQAEVRQHLAGMDRGQLSDRLDLDDDRLPNDQIDPKAFLEVHAVAIEADRPLTFDMPTGTEQIAAEHGLIHGLEQPRPPPKRADSPPK